MGVLYDVLFKPMGRGDGSTAAAAVVGDGPATAAAVDDTHTPPPQWVLDGRDSGSLVWRRYDSSPSCRRRVRFLDAVEVRVFERDEYADDRDDCAAADEDGDGQLCWADDWSWGDDDGCGSKTSFCGQADRDDYPVLVALSVTVLGLCIGLTYLFAPVKWLFHQLLVD